MKRDMEILLRDKCSRPPEEESAELDHLRERDREWQEREREWQEEKQELLV